MPWQVQNTRLYYPDMLLSIDGSWNEADTAKFSSGCRIRFKEASVVMDGERITVYPMQGDPYSPELPQTNHMAEEIRAFVEIIRGNAENQSNPPESARDTVRLMEKLFVSAKRNGEIINV